MSSAQQQQQASPQAETALDVRPEPELSLTEMSRIMDVAVALRRERSLAERGLNRDETRRMLREKPREVAQVTGGSVTEAEIDAAISHYYDRLHAFEEPPPSWRTWLAHLYIRRVQLGWLLAALAGLTVSEDETVFASPDGSLTHPDYFSQVFDRHLAASDLPRIRFHDLRHTHATILLKTGVHVKVVSERLGHSSPAFTMTVYQHVIPGMQADAARLFCEALYWSM